MITYLFIVILLVIGILSFDIGNHKPSLPFFYFVLISLILLTGFQVENGALGGGGDYFEYRYDFRDYPTLGNLKLSDLIIGGQRQPLWVIFSSLIRTIYPSYEFYLICHSILINTICLTFIRKNTKYVYTAISIFVFTTTYFYFNLEVQRESIAVCVFLISLKSLKEKRFVKYYLWAVVAFLFHISSAFMFFLPLVYPMVEKVRPKWTFFAVVALMAAITYVPSIIPTDIIFAEKAIQGTLYQAANYATIEQDATELSHATMVSSFVAISYMMLLFIYVKSGYEKSIFYFLIIMEILVSFGNGFIPGMYRIENYFAIPMYVIISSFIHTKSLNYKKLFVVFFLCFCLFNLYKITRPRPSIGKDKCYYNMWVPYRSVFDDDYNYNTYQY